MLNFILMASTIFLFASLGELFDQLSGILNIGLEGIILVGALTGFAIGKTTGNPWIGILGAMVASGLVGLIHGFLSITLKVQQVVSGTGIWLFGLGITTYLGATYSGASEVRIPAIIAGMDPLFFIGIALFPLFWIVIYKTNFGLRVRAVGENPSAAAVSGINVGRIRYVSVFIGGVLVGLSGAYLSLVYSGGLWTPGLSAGRGFIALALVFFGMWRLSILLFGSLLFGALWITGFWLQNVLPGTPSYLLQMIPYSMTIIVLVVISTQRFGKKARAPAALGKPYFHEK